MSWILANWKTTLTGVLTIASAFVPGGPAWLPVVIAGLGQVLGRDGNISSEQSGVVKK